MKSYREAFAYLSFACLLFNTQPAASEHVSLFPDFAGEWRSDGEAFGAPAESVMTWTPALKDNFVRLDYRIEMQTGGAAASVFQGVAYYRSAEGGAIHAFWADNSGDMHPIVAERDGDALVADWGVDGGKQGRTRYDLLASDLIEVTDWIKTPDGWRQFNQNRFIRASD